MKKLLLFFALCLVGASHSRAMAQGAWQKISMTEGGKPIPALRAIATPAVAECNGQKFTARLVWLAHLTAGKVDSVHLIVVLDDLKKTVPAQEREQFEGPDLPALVTAHDAMDISFTAAGVKNSFATRALLSSPDSSFPAEIRGQETEAFESNLRSSRKELDRWREFLHTMSNGLDDGMIVLGGPVLSHPITVHFSGQGIQLLASEMLQSAQRFNY